MFTKFEKKFFQGININKGAFGFEPGKKVLLKLKRRWNPGIIIGTINRNNIIYLCVLEKSYGSINIVCISSDEKHQIKIADNDESSLSKSFQDLKCSIACS